MAGVDGSSLFGEALLWTKFNGIIERFSHTYITMGGGGGYLHIIQCKTIELSTTAIVCSVIAFPQLKCTSNERGSKQKLQSRAHVARRCVYAINIKAGPVSSLKKKCAAPVRRLLNTAMYPLKTRDGV